MGIHIINGNCFWDIIYPLGGMYAKCSKPLLVDKLLRERLYHPIRFGEYLMGNPFSQYKGTTEGFDHRSIGDYNWDTEN